MRFITFFILVNQYIVITHAGNCFNHRINDMCYDLSEADVSEDQCSGSYYSDDIRQELDGYAYAEKCREVNNVPKRCDVDCGLGQECQWINDEEMCVCSAESCTATDSTSSKKHNQPLCASNNVTFSSECAMEAWKCMNHQSALYKKYDGECQKDCRNVKCPHETICLLVRNTGEPFCYPKKHCNPSADPEPVCGTNGVTYRNICAMRLSPDEQGRTPELAHKGRCETKCRPNLCQPSERCVYSRQAQPVCIRCQYSPRFLAHSGECSMDVRTCGDDGHLYKNYCALLRGQCEKNRYIHIVDYDTCPVKMNTMQ
ncbi:unnamed protein product [Adineta ricciae]|uniref:Kazal-like domain-containing protein n=1 Tax=Adineta ricciae TaxID=249248 RepID=A0A813WY67_ADIRI|nr:unnamed protein product [Adineta ricciae]